MSERIGTKKLLSATESVNPQLHDEFVALCALYYSKEISEEEWALLQIHMAYCDECHKRFLEYQQITSNVIPSMAAVAASESDNAPEESAESIAAAERRLMSRLDSVPKQQEPPRNRRFSWHLPAAILAACAAVIVCLVGSHFVRIKRQSPPQAASGELASRKPQSVAPESPRTDGQLAAKEQEQVASLKQQLAASEERSKQSSLALEEMKKQLRDEQAAQKQINGEKEALSEQLAAAQAEATSLRAKLTSSGSDTNQLTTRIATLETRVHELNAALDEKNVALNDKDRMLALDQDFLAHDRDIRDLIGARNLYIADIFDTTESGKTARQFGRIFYTQDRSLVFYGFDLDSQASHKQDVSFQAWGSGSDKAHPVSLGLFYQDDAHKRWVLRCNDAKTLARLDMVFVTVEPPGGSARPTGKQFLRAYLQVQPNHP